MSKREPIIPSRFDSRDAVAGLKAIEQSSQAAGDLGQAADAASTRFRKAHESVQSAMQDYDVLRRTLQQNPSQDISPTSGGLAADEAIGGIAARFPAGDWLESQEGLRGAAGARLGGLAASQSDEQAGRPPQGWPALSNARGMFSQQGAELSDSRPEDDHRGTLARTNLPIAGSPAGPADQSPEGSLGLESSSPILLGRTGTPPGGLGTSTAIAPDERTGQSRRESPASDSMTGDLDMSGILADVWRRQVSVQGSADPGGGDLGGFGRPERMAREAVADYVGWMTGDGDGGRNRVAATRRDGAGTADGAAGAQQRDPQALQGAAGAWNNVGGLAEGLDPREAIWRARASAPGAARVDDAAIEGQTMQPGRRRAGSSPGEWDSEARSGVASTGAIERLLREQNELMRQDLHQNANSPLAAPPPLRGGGIRM
jgi:hypothetical protein